MRTSLVFVCLATLAAGCADDDPDAGASTAADAAASTPTSAEPPEAPSTTNEAPTTTGEAASTTTTTTTTTTSTVPATTVPATTVPTLAGRTFVSTSVTGFELAPGVQITLSFQGDQLAASGGCNQLASTWSLDGDVLVVAEIASTRMACEPASLMDQDTWLSSLLTSDPTVALDGDTLTLTEGQSSITLAAS